MYAGTQVLVEINGELVLAQVLYNKYANSDAFSDGTLIAVGVVLESGKIVNVTPDRMITD